MSKIRQYFYNYSVSRENFEKFHNQVINMPRDSFTNVNIEKLQSLASYLLLLENQGDNDYNYPSIRLALRTVILGNPPVIDHRDTTFENDFLQPISLNEQEERLFRHIMGDCAFFGMLKTITRQRKIIDFDKCREYLISSKQILMPLLRNYILNINISNNGYINNLTGIVDIKSNADYRPAYGILKYMKDIGRAVTDFELSVLLGRIDEEQEEHAILKRAIDIGKELPASNRNAQLEYFFNAMGWKNENNVLFSYSASQQPFFKFRTFILFLTAFDLISCNNVDKKYSLTKYAENILEEDIPFYIADLEALINLLSEDVSDVKLRDILMSQYDEKLMEELLNREDFVIKMNLRSINAPVMIDGKRKRNKFIAELAKIKAKYLCQAGTTTFKQPNGRNYVEAHHIIEFSKNGPDIIDNLLVLGPTPHTLLHRGSLEAIEDLYNQLKLNGVITFALFENMVKTYKCLSKEHVDLLFDRKLISQQQKSDLLNII